MAVRLFLVTRPIGAGGSLTVDGVRSCIMAVDAAGDMSDTGVIALAIDSLRRSGIDIPDGVTPFEEVIPFDELRGVFNQGGQLFPIHRD